jgi:hypothetical protein
MDQIMGSLCGGGENVLRDKVIRISWGRSEHDDDGNEPVFEETDEGGVEGFVGGEEAGEGEDALATDFLNHCM